MAGLGFRVIERYRAQEGGVYRHAFGFFPTSLSADSWRTSIMSTIYGRQFDYEIVPCQENLSDQEKQMEMDKADRWLTRARVYSVVY